MAPPDPPLTSVRLMGNPVMHVATNLSRIKYKRGPRTSATGMENASNVAGLTGYSGDALQAWAVGLSPQLSLSPFAAVKHTGQEFGGELREIFKFSSFLASAVTTCKE